MPDTTQARRQQNRRAKLDAAAAAAGWKAWSEYETATINGFVTVQHKEGIRLAARVFDRRQAGYRR